MPGNALEMQIVFSKYASMRIPQGRNDQPDAIIIGRTFFPAANCWRCQLEIIGRMVERKPLALDIEKEVIYFKKYF